MNELEIIKSEVDTLLEKLAVEASAQVTQKDEFFQVAIQMEGADASSTEAGILIGYHGETLSALQLILSLIISKKLGRFVRLIVNVGDYREKREEKLKEMALEAARRAKETKQEVILGNLSPWQRRIIHIALADDSDIQTESQGEEPDRQLIIKPRK
ncbi:KH domain-containing protein [Candidatus Microgenomates bacterium]|nr:KH domain-containing protein [Candidatus Microgenomates bacterium]